MSDLLSGLVGALVGGIVAAAAAVWAMRQQIHEMRHDMQAQTYLRILERAQDVELSTTMDFIRLSFDDSPGIHDRKSPEQMQPEPTAAERNRYRWFSKKVSKPRRTAMRRLIDFFNDLAHLMRNHYIDDHYVARLYYPSVHACAIKLSPWWTKCMRLEHNEENLYINFENLCSYILALHGEEIQWPGFREWLDKEGRTT